MCLSRKRNFFFSTMAANQFFTHYGANVLLLLLVWLIVFFFFLFSLLLFHIVSYYLCLMCTHHIYSHLTLAHSPIPFDTFVNVCARIAVVVVVCCVWRCSMLLLYSHAFHVENFGAVVRYLGNGMNVTTL